MTKTSKQGLQQQLDKEKASRLSLMADFENFRKRMEAERETFGVMANLAIISEIAEIYDDLQLALNDSDLNIESAKQAVLNAQQKLMNAIKQSGIELISPSEGDEFVGEQMEAITTVPNPEVQNKVVTVVGTGLKHSARGTVIKPAKVIVGK